MEYTTNLNLSKPDYDSIADIEVLDNNFDILDEQFDGSHLVKSVNNNTPVNGNVTVDLGVTSVNGMTGAVIITERTVKQLIDIIYPVGSYYDTSDTTFNPNTSWGGTWEKIVDGTVLIAGGGNYTVGSKYGELTHKLTINELPSHNHTATSSEAGSHTHTIGEAGSHTHTRGSMNITGQTYGEGGGNGDYGCYKGAFYMDNTSGIRGNGSGDTDSDNRRVLFDASLSWSGQTSSNGNHAHTISTVGNHKHTISVNSTGSGLAFNLLQPSTAVARWHRTA